MGLIKFLAIALIITGTLGLIYGNFSFPKKKHEAILGPIEIAIKETKTVNVPVWAGVSAIVLGSVLLIFESKKQRQ